LASFQVSLIGQFWVSPEATLPFEVPHRKITQQIENEKTESVNRKWLPKPGLAGYNNSCPGSVLLAGFEVLISGRFWGDHRGGATRNSIPVGQVDVMLNGNGSLWITYQPIDSTEMLSFEAMMQTIKLMPGNN